MPAVPASGDHPGIDELVIGDPPDAWRAAGFAVDSDGTSRIGTVRVNLVGRDGAKGVRSWALRGVALGGSDLDGLPTTVGSAGPVEPAVHPNGTCIIDHVVVATPDMQRTVTLLENAGLAVRRVRDTDSYGAPMRQTFFRLDEVVLEVVGPPESRAGLDDRSARFFGLAFSVEDLDVLAGQLGDHLGRIKDAVQPGRRIATLRHRDAGLSVAIAFMDDAPSH